MTTYRLETVTETPSSSETLSLKGTGLPLQAPDFHGQPIFQMPNRQTTDQTHTEDVDGSSAPLAPIPHRFPLLPTYIWKPREHFIVLQKWEGHVTEVDETTFRARLHPLAGEGTDQEAEIYTEEVSPQDRALIQPGSIFYWSIGYLDRPSGRIRASIIRFRRLPTWSESQLAAAKAAASRLRTIFDAGDST